MNKTLASILTAFVILAIFYVIVLLLIAFTKAVF